MSTGDYTRMADWRDGTKRRCKVCEEWKERTEFYRKSGYTCKPCRNAQITRQRRESGKGFEHKLWVRYGLRLEDYSAMLATQGGSCALCVHRSKLVVDHDHETGKVRGILCYSCNLKLSGVENAQWLTRAIEYKKGGGRIAE